MNEIATFEGKSLVLRFISVLIFFIIGYSILDYQVIGGVALIFGGLIASTTFIVEETKTVLYDDMIIVHKLFQKKEVHFQMINSIYIENRAQGLYNVSKCLIISYTEPSGYGDELVYLYDKNMHEIIENATASFKRNHS